MEPLHFPTGADGKSDHILSHDSAFEPHEDYGFENGDDFRHYLELTADFQEEDMMDAEQPALSDELRQNDGASPGGSLFSDRSVFTHVQGVSGSTAEEAVELWQPLSQLRADSSKTVVHGQPMPPSALSNIVRSRNCNASQQYGQVTLPDDSSNPHLTARVSNSASHQEHPSGPDAQKRRQELARKAPTLRHSRPKDARFDIQQMDDIGDGDEDDPVDKRDVYREKNRLAAAKCRSKKKANMNVLEERHRYLSAEFSNMKRQERELRDELSAWRTLALEHRAGHSMGCNCASIHQYNLQKAEEMTFGCRQSGGQALSPPLQDDAATTRQS